MKPLEMIFSKRNRSRCLGAGWAVLVLLAAGLVTLGDLTPSAAWASVSVRGRLTHEKQARPGETYESGIYVSNTGDEVEQVKVYQTDYLFTCDGKYYYGDPGTTPRSNANWIEFGPTRLTIPPQGGAVVNYKVAVPDDPKLTGTYWSIIMIEVISKGSPEMTGQHDGKVNLGINQVFRFGVQIVTEIEDTGLRKIKFLDSRLLWDSGKRTLRVDLENTGEQWLRPSLWAELYDTTGAFVGKFEAGPLRVYPGTSVRYEVDLSQLKIGNYKAVVIADCGEDDVFGATYSLSVQDENSASGN
ncbi:MAG TPA: hypothetical protein VMU02_06795 [bacterium]|nr:hypothetical protein [bacterium]